MPAAAVQSELSSHFSLQEALAPHISRLCERPSSTCPKSANAELRQSNKPQQTNGLSELGKALVLPHRQTGEKHDLKNPEEF